MLTQNNFKRNVVGIQFLIIFLLGVLFGHTVYAGTLSCVVTTAAGCANTVLLRMSSSTNAHAELPGLSNANYANNVICCTGVTGLGNSCAGTYATVAKLSSSSNAHLEQNNQSNYSTSTCISVPPGGSVSIGYQPTNCSGFDTTLASMEDTTNSHLGNTTAYTEYKICGTAAGPVAQSLTFSISDNTIGFGSLVSGGARYATGDVLGSGSNSADAHTISLSTNAPSGYTMSISGATLTSGVNTIATTSANTASTVGSEQFGLRLIANSGTGTVTAPYAAAGFAFDSNNFPDQVASGSGDDVTTVFGARYIGNISANTESGSYSSALTYIVTAAF